MANEARRVNEDAVHSCIEALKKIFIVEDIPAWNPNLRSKSAIRITDTRYYVDSSIATANLGIGSDDLINDLKMFGLLPSAERQELVCRDKSRRGRDDRQRRKKPAQVEGRDGHDENESAILI